MHQKTDRRCFLARGVLGAAGSGAAYSSIEEKTLLAAMQDETAQPQASKAVKTEIPPGSLPCGKIGNVSISRLIIGGNLIGGWAHARDLMYTSNLFKAYNTEAKIFETLEIAQACGINTIQIDLIAQGLDLIKAQGVPAGVGCHSPAVVVACEKDKLNVDFYMKTFHLDRYWSATPREKRPAWSVESDRTSPAPEYHDHMWCYNPEETAAFMEKVEKPWLAFKVMAAGAIAPRMAFSHAYRCGADFIVAGMFDFQVENDVKLAIESLQKARSRKRPWRA